MARSAGDTTRSARQRPWQRTAPESAYSAGTGRSVTGPSWVSWRARPCRSLASTGLMLPAGTPLPAEVTAVGRGPVLHVIAADRWYQVALDELTPR